MKSSVYSMIIHNLHKKYGERYEDVREGMIKEGLSLYMPKLECSRRQYISTICKDFNLVRKQSWSKEWLEKKEEQVCQEYVNENKKQ